MLWSIINTTKNKQAEKFPGYWKKKTHAIYDMAACIDMETRSLIKKFLKGEIKDFKVRFDYIQNDKHISSEYKIQKIAISKVNLEGLTEFDDGFFKEEE